MRLTGIPKIDEHNGVLIGSDEAGYGTLAGSLFVVSVQAPMGWDDPAARDSKALTDEARRRLVDKYEDRSDFKISRIEVGSSEIDANGVYKSLVAAHGRAVNQILYHPTTEPRLVVIDGNLPCERMGIDFAEAAVMSLPKADSILAVVGLASCFAKTLQVDSMRALAKEFPGYGFDKHHGYPTKDHKSTLGALGPCRYHRMSYEPVRLAHEARKGRHVITSQEYQDPKAAWDRAQRGQEVEVMDGDRKRLSLHFLSDQEVE